MTSTTGATALHVKDEEGSDDEGVEENPINSKGLWEKGMKESRSLEACYGVEWCELLVVTGGSEAEKVKGRLKKCCQQRIGISFSRQPFQYFSSYRYSQRFTSDDLDIIRSKPTQNLIADSKIMEEKEKLNLSKGEKAVRARGNICSNI
ncbi:hypothetical protein MRB53_029640 [Persea americana]|uniref:Uncharacterized protein n=1 Tax=Persea americana TaxID=3435 RepID=A0ACC2KJB0_PERAE|nr:hypothetical protein MRB53_029640 [Persea americana]